MAARFVIFLQAILGGNVTLIGTGAAPIEAKVLTFFKVVFGCCVSDFFSCVEFMYIRLLNMYTEM